MCYNYMEAVADVVDIGYTSSNSTPRIQVEFPRECIMPPILERFCACDYKLSIK
jgi:hypothetical protein